MIADLQYHDFKLCLSNASSTKYLMKSSLILFTEYNNLFFAYSELYTYVLLNINIYAFRCIVLFLVLISCLPDKNTSEIISLYTEHNTHIIHLFRFAQVLKILSEILCDDNK